MCGIAGVIDSLATAEQNREILTAMLSKIKHRGEEEHTYEIKVLPHGAFGCNRLAIVDREHGYQPITNAQGTLLAILNGEIYNHQQLEQELTEMGYQFRTHCDTEVLVYGYQEWKEQLIDHLDGKFAFVVYDHHADTFLAARDHIGIKPLYYLHDDNRYLIASEMKSLLPFGQHIQTLQPGHILTQNGAYAYDWLAPQPQPESEAAIIATFKELLKAAVKKRVTTDLPIGVIFSGGLDSAAILSLASRYHTNITALTVGFEGATDIPVAQRYCKEMGIPHRIIHLNIEDMVHNLPETIYYGETFESIDIMDACVISPAFKLAQEMGLKIVLSGEGSDEVLAGYDFFKEFPDPQYLMTYRLSNLHWTDLQRVDRCSMRYTVEARIPFLDRAFLNFAYHVPMALKLRNGIEKWILREAMKDDLPDYILHRPKIRMPDGSGLRNQLLEFARRQRPTLDPAIAERLGIDQADGAYFLEQYLTMGFPVPQTRYKKPGLDFSTHGYFHFS